MLDSISSKGENEVLRLRSSILEAAGYVDGMVDLVLAFALSYDDAGLNVLAGKLLPRLPLGVRVQGLQALLEARDEADDWPFLAFTPEVLPIRNTLAHMSLDVYESTDTRLVFSNLRKGADNIQILTLQQLKDTDAKLWHISIDLFQLYQSMDAAEQA